MDVELVLVLGVADEEHGPDEGVEGGVIVDFGVRTDNVAACLFPGTHYVAARAEYHVSGLGWSEVCAVGVGGDTEITKLGVKVGSWDDIGVGPGVDEENVVGWIVKGPGL